MTREEARKAAEVMLAYANGKEIESFCDDGYVPCGEPYFNWGLRNYRIKPKEKFDPKTLQPFDKVLVMDKHSNQWTANFYSHYRTTMDKYPIVTIDGGLFNYVIPYNEETKPLLWTCKEAPEYYRYWED